MRALFAGLLSCLFVSSVPSLAQEPPAATADGTTAQLDTVVVTGEQPGPGLWKVSKGDHVLWVLGTQSPLPQKMQWRAREVEERVAQSQAVLLSPGLYIKSGVGFWGRLALIPSLIGIRNNPDGKKLAQIVPAEQYARWQPLKQRYLGRGNKVEKWRPLFAAMELYSEAIKRNGMTGGNDLIGERVAAFSKQAGIKPTAVKVTVEVKQPRAAIKEFKHSTLDDLDCFSKTIDRIEADLDNMKLRANAWATGDIDALRALPYTNQYVACMEAMQSATVLKDFGDVGVQTKQAWIEAASKALETHASTVALLPISDIIGDEKYLSALVERGYRVEAPDEVDEVPATAAQP